MRTLRVLTGIVALAAAKVTEGGFDWPSEQVEAIANTWPRSCDVSFRLQPSSEQSDRWAARSKEGGIEVVVLGKAAALSALSRLVGVESCDEALPRLMGDGSGGAIVLNAAGVRAQDGWQASPAWPTQERALSEEGQLWDIPDPAYYTDSAPFVNQSRLRAECDELLATNAVGVLHAQANAIVLLHHDVEDYVTYDNLTGPAVWQPNSTHSVRAPVMAAELQQCLQRIKTALGVRTYLQPYEFAFPTQLCDQGRNCSVGSADLDEILAVRYAELFARVPALDGIVATVTDSWRPRCGYDFQVLWHDMATLGRTATALHQAIVQRAGKELVFRLWVLGSAVDWAEFVQSTPPSLRLSVKATEDDFTIDSPLNALLGNATVLHQRRFAVLVDSFRQYNGWGRAMCTMMQQWPERLTTALRNGAQDLNVWGAWSPGCTWPTSAADDELLNASSTSGERSWAGHWNAFRLFGGAVTHPQSGGFQGLAASPSSSSSWSGVANTRLAGALGAGTEPEEALRSTCALFLGTTDADVLGNCSAALNASMGVWWPVVEPQGDFAWQWAMIVNADEDKLQRSFGSMTAQALDASALPAAQANSLMQSAAHSATSAAGKVDPVGAVKLHASINVTTLYASTLVCFKEVAWWSLVGVPHKTTPAEGPTGCATFVEGKAAGTTACDALEAATARLQQLMEIWQDPASDLSVLGTYWQVHAPDPFLDSRPSFWSDAKHGAVYPRSIAEWASWLVSQANCHSNQA